MPPLKPMGSCIGVFVGKQSEQEVLVNKIILFGIFVAIFLAGLGVIMSHYHIGFDQLLRSLSDLNPRVLSLIALPFIAVLFVLGVYLRKRHEERMWKKALLRTRAKKLTKKQEHPRP